MAKHTDDDRDKALRHYTADGLAAAHHATGIPKSTIRDWARAQKLSPPAHADSKTGRAVEAQRVRWDKRRLDLKHRMGSVAALALDVAEEKLAAGKARDAKDAMLSAAIAIDKAEALDVHADPEASAGRAADRADKLEQARQQGLSLVPGAAA